MDSIFTAASRGLRCYCTHAVQSAWIYTVLSWSAIVYCVHVQFQHFDADNDDDDGVFLQEMGRTEWKAVEYYWLSSLGFLWPYRSRCHFAFA